MGDLEEKKRREGRRVVSMSSAAELWGRKGPAPDRVYKGYLLIGTQDWVLGKL